MGPQSNAVGETTQAQPSIFPQSTSGTTPIKGAAVNRFASNGSIAGSCVMSGRSGASTGSPSSYTTTYKLQHSADTTDADFSDYTDPTTGAAASFVVTQSSPAGTSADNKSGHLNVDLSAAKQYIRVVETPAFTGGSSPTVPVSADLVLGGFSGGAAVPVPSYS